MKIPKITIEQLLEAGVHLGHKTLRWNPKMKRYIFGKRDSIHIIDKCCFRKSSQHYIFWRKNIIYIY